MDKIGDWIIIVLLFIYFICGSIWSANILIHLMKCTNILDCTNRECKYKGYCNSHREVLTEDEAEELIKRLEELSSITSKI